MIITKTDELKTICDRLSAGPYVTLDTEFIREKTYYAELCLIQLAGPDIETCIDPLSPDLDLSPLFELLQNRSVVKVFHAARQDIEIFYHMTRQIPTPLFDTQLAAMLCGYGENVGYQQLVQDICGVSLDKSMRFTDWKRRPLNQDQVKYALHDVTFLRDIYTHFSRQLQENNRMTWLDRELSVQNDPKTYETDNDTVWKKIKIPFKKPIQVHIFSRLCAWREQTAKFQNKPRKHIVRDDVLLELSATLPRRIEDINMCRSLPKNFGASTYGKEMFAVIQQALSEPSSVYPTGWKQTKPLTATQHTLLDLYHLLLRIVSDSAGVAPKIIASGDELTELVRGNNQVPCMQDWRRALFGDKVLLFKQGRLTFGYNPKTHRAEIFEK